MRQAEPSKHAARAAARSPHPARQGPLPRATALGRQCPPAGPNSRANSNHSAPTGASQITLRSTAQKGGSIISLFGDGNRQPFDITSCSSDHFIREIEVRFSLRPRGSNVDRITRVRPNAVLREISYKLFESEIRRLHGSSCRTQECHRRDVRTKSFLMDGEISHIDIPLVRVGPELVRLLSSFQLACGPCERTLSIAETGQEHQGCAASLRRLHFFSCRHRLPVQVVGSTDGRQRANRRNPVRKRPVVHGHSFSQWSAKCSRRTMPCGTAPTQTHSVGNER